MPTYADICRRLLTDAIHADADRRGSSDAEPPPAAAPQLPPAFQALAVKLVVKLVVKLIVKRRRTTARHRSPAAPRLSGT